ALVLRSRLADDPGFAEMVQRVRQTTLDAHAHQGVPFEELVETLQPERNLSVSPLFQVMFDVKTDAGWATGLSGLEARTMEAEGGTAKFDLSLNVVDLRSEEVLALSLEHRTQLFDATTAVRVLDHLERLLAGAVAEPDRRISELSFLSE